MKGDICVMYFVCSTLRSIASMLDIEWLVKCKL